MWKTNFCDIFKRMENKTMKASVLLVKCLENEGVNYIFGIPGEENLAFLDALKDSKINLIVTRNEQSAVFMASTVGRLTGKVGVALSTLGPGATNLMTGIAYAQLGGMPLLVITGQKPIHRSKQGKFQIVDTVRMMEPITKFSSTILSADLIPSLVKQAIRTAESERPGAVHLELSEDVAEEHTNKLPIISEKVRRPDPDTKSIDNAVAEIEKAYHPLIIVGASANRKLIRKQLKSFLDKTKIPFVTTQMGKGVEDENSEFYIGTTSLSAGDYVHRAIDEADCIIMIGHDTNEKPPAIFSAVDHTIIHINFYQSEIDEVYIPKHEVIGDISNALWQMTEKINVRSNWNFNYFHKVRDEFNKSLEAYKVSSEFPIIPQYAVSVINKIMPKCGILSLDNGMYKIWISRNYKASEQNSVLLDNALATMGAGLSAGISAKILNPEKKVLVVAGDGGFMMNVAELETAKRLNLDLVILILNDNGYGMIKWKQKDMSLDRFGLDFSNPDFVKLAESFGAHGYRVESANDLEIILKKTLNTSGIHIIDCPVDYSRTNDDLGKNLKEIINNL